jgi:hypothetical protein
MNATKTINSDLFKDFHPQSKVWIYGSSRELSEEECKQIENQLNVFTTQWTAHDKALKGAAAVIYRRFLVLAVDETQTNASGCSIDKSVHFIQSLETLYSLHLFDRLNIYYLMNDKMKSFHFNDLQKLINSGEINGETLIFDATITRLSLLQSGFLIAIKESWLARYF